MIDDEGALLSDYHAIQLKSNGTQFSEPGTVIYVEKKSSTAYVLHGAGTSTFEIVGMNVNISSSGSGDLGTKYTAGASMFGVSAMLEDENGNGFDHCWASTNTDYKYWYLHPIDRNGTGTQYFGVAPLETDKIGDYYFTTLRTSFSFNLSSNVNAFVVRKNGNVYILDEVTGTIPANTPIILQCKSTNPSDNRLFPVAIGGKFNVESSVTSELVSGTQYEYFKTNAPNAKSNGNYTKGQSYGFGTAFSSVNENYKVLRVKDGKLGFFDKFTEAYPNDLCINGELAYMNTSEDIVLLEEADLATIVDKGAEGASYVTNNLYGVTVADGKLYAKDYGLYANPSTKPDEAVDYMDRAGMQACDDYDQSNWVALNVDNPDSYVGKDLSVTGTLLRKPNPEMTVTKITATTPANSNYNPNVYIPASFMGETQTSPVGNQNTYFFVTPKPQEYAHITWAVYGGNGKFYIAAPQGSVNQAALKGGFVANDAFMPAGSSLSSFETDDPAKNTYEFDAIIMRSTPSKADPYTDGGLSTDWVVYPLTSPSVITAVSDVNTSKTVMGTKYYNLAGLASDQPFDGINIVVTTFSDGSKQAVKVLH